MKVFIVRIFSSYFSLAVHLREDDDVDGACCGCGGGVN